MEYSNLETKLQIYWGKQQRKLEIAQSDATNADETTVEAVPVPDPPEPSKKKVVKKERRKAASKPSKKTGGDERKRKAMQLTGKSSRTNKPSHSTDLVTVEKKPSNEKKQHYVYNSIGQRILLNDYQSGSDVGSELSNSDAYNSDNSFTDYASIERETKDPNVCEKWASIYRYFKDNKPDRKCGYGNFPFHLAAYLFWRDRSGKGGKFNPTNGERYTFDNNPDVQQSIYRFACHVLKMDGTHFRKFLRTGDVMKFKRAMKPRTVKKVKMPIDEEYERVRDSLDISGF